MTHKLILILSLFLVACSNVPESIDLSVINTYSDTSLTKIDTPLNNDYRDISRFDIKTGNNYIDSLIISFSKDNFSTYTLKENICGGDNCTSLKTSTNPKTQTTMHFVKGDNSEYGFFNSQYVLCHDTLKFVREFNVDIEIMPTDSTPTVWNCEETILYFNNNLVKSLEKNVLTKKLDNFDFTLTNQQFEIKLANGAALNKLKCEQLKKLLSMKSED